MLSRSSKEVFYLCFGPLMKLNGWVCRNLKSERNGVVKAHLGPGQRNYLEGWINVDANMFTSKCDIWADLRNKLPFRENSVDAIYSHHVIEHLPNLPFHFKEMFRVLKPNGIIRVGGPHGNNAIKKYLENDISWFSDFPDKRTSIGGRFENFLFCRGEHLTVLTDSWLQELAQQSGFENISFCKPVNETNYPNLIDELVTRSEDESTPRCPHTILLEAQKPALR